MGARAVDADEFGPEDLLVLEKSTMTMEHCHAVL